MAGLAPAADQDALAAAPAPAGKPKKSPLAEELNALRLDLSRALFKSHPIDAATRADELAAVAKLVPIYERGLKLAADHPDAPEAKAARSWAANGFAVFCVSSRARTLLDATLETMPAAERAGVLVSLGQSLARTAGRPWYARAEAVRLNAEAEAVLVKALKDTDASDDPRAVQTKRRAEDELFVVRKLSAGKTAPEVVARTSTVSP
jgi:hypothetical protein